jgi:hypothetical protein
MEAGEAWVISEISMRRKRPAHCGIVSAMGSRYREEK